MYVDLPDTGCNVLINDYSFYNYSPDGRTRTQYVIYEGRAFQINQSTNYNAYSYNGTCLHDTDLQYAPIVSQIVFPFLSFGLCAFAFYLVYATIIKRLLP